MTHSGGRPHAVGDKGQRYEVLYRSAPLAPLTVFGWADTKEGYQAMVDSINLHPSWHGARVYDRTEKRWITLL